MAKLDPYDTSFNAAAAPPAVTVNTVATHGQASDIVRLTLETRSDAKQQQGLANILAVSGDTAKFCTYAQTVAAQCLPADAATRGDTLHTQIATPAITLLSKLPGSAVAAAIDDVIACAQPADRQELLSRMLRMAGNGGHTDIARHLLTAGADARTQNCRALLNALNNGHTDVARVLRAAGADLDIMRGEAITLKYTDDQFKKLGSAVCKLVDATSDPADFYHAARYGTASSLEEKNTTRAHAMELFRCGDAAPLQQFLRGYLEFKRSEERKRGSNEGYTTHVSKPLIALMMEAADPALALARALAALPARDSETASGLVLRALCANGASTMMIDAAIDAGGDIALFGNMALSLAVRGGHSDIALHLVRRHGANIGEAVLDAQINSIKSEEMAKLYSFMAALTTPQVISAPAFKIQRKGP